MPAYKGRKVPARSNKGGAVRGKARKAQVQSMNAQRRAAAPTGRSRKPRMTGRRTS